MTLPQECDDVNTVETWLNSQHPILGNFDLPVEIEGAPKPSGSGNLPRKGWDEDGCRDFLVRLLGHIPRNYNYGDGLRIIYPRLRERFGDENLEIAVGVLYELIEVESLVPFPEAVYQRWKYEHMHRHENFQLPHVPHCRVIVGPPQPSHRLLKWRAQNPKPRVAWTENTPATPMRNCATGSPISPTFSTAHVPSGFRIEHSVFVSTGGQKATVYPCPTPAQYHERLRIEKSGRGGKLVGVREISTANLDQRLPPPMDTKYINPGPRVPNAIFARKHHIEDEYKPLPNQVQNGAALPSADEKVLQPYAELRNDALATVSKLPGAETLKECDRQHQELQAIGAYIRSYKAPATPGLFFDSGLDFKWGDGSLRLMTAKQSDRLGDNEEPVNIAFAQRNSMFGETVGIEADKEHSILRENEEANSLCFTVRSEDGSQVVADDHKGKATSSSTQEGDTTFDGGKGEMNISVIEDGLAKTFISTQEWTQNWRSRAGKLTTFDGSADDFDFLPQSDHINNTTIRERSFALPRFYHSMDVNQGQTRLPVTSVSSAQVKPLHVRKLPPQTHIARDQQSSNDRNPQLGSSEKPVYPPRTSSICSHKTYCDPATFQPPTTRDKTASVPPGSEEYSIATSGQGHYTSYYSTDAHSTDINTGGSTVSSTKSQYLSDTSSAIMGDFVPIDSPNMAGLQPTMEPTKVSLQGGLRPFQVANVNPYEFEPPTPYNDPTRRTIFTHFIKQGQEAEPTGTPRAGHVKNARSEGNTLYMAQNSAHPAATPTKPNGEALYRCESSPNVSQLPCPSRRNVTLSSDILQYYTEPREADSPVRRGRSEDCTPRGGQDVVPLSPRRRHQDYTQETSRSPTRRSPQASSSKGYTINRNFTRSPTMTLDDVYERDEYDDGIPSRISKNPPPSPPKKRSRSPMKKMFGEHGWLGQSPDEKPDPKLRSKKSFVTHMDFASRPKKIGMMEKLKNKFEEIAEKADLSPMGRSRSNSDKQKLSILSISLGPPEQARIYMEIELMLVHTANNFLMNQFSQGRMDVDSIKKAVDLWKNKGRPVVIEFMYDQATQRDLVVANQQNFRFHGDKAGSDIRISSMLYNWKQVASHMVIRTFCNADTVILKLLFDIEQILDLLGAGEPMMIRLQQIRATATEMMRVARHNKDTKANTQQSFRGREPPRISESSGGSILYSQPMEDPYGGLKLVPDSYKE